MLRNDTLLTKKVITMPMQTTVMSKIKSFFIFPKKKKEETPITYKFNATAEARLRQYITKCFSDWEGIDFSHNTLVVQQEIMYTVTNSIMKQWTHKATQGNYGVIEYNDSINTFYLLPMWLNRNVLIDHVISERKIWKDTFQFTDADVIRK